MQTRKIESGYLMKFSTGEEIVSGLVKFCIDSRIVCGSFTAIGATTKVTLGFYSLAKKEYHWKEFFGEFEITGGVGNIAMFEEKPMVHMHTSIADAAFNAFGGHVKSLVVGATCEVVLTIYAEKLERKADVGVGLNLWGLEAALPAAVSLEVFLVKSQKAI